MGSTKGSHMPTTTIQETKRDEGHTNETNDESQVDTEPGTSSELQTATDSTGDATLESRRTLSRDVVFGLLSAKRRRRLLQYLDENEGQTTIGDVAEHIGAAENGVEVAQLSSDQRKRVYVALYQCHLPKMDDAGVIEYDRNRGTIELRERAEQLFPHLYLDPDRDVIVGSPRDVVRSTRLYDLSTALLDRLAR